MMKLKLIFATAFLSVSFGTVAQDSSRLFFSTGVGLIKSPGKLSKVFHPSVAFNSGLEITNKKNWFAQGTLDFNTLKYNQRIKDDGSPYLFKNTSSSLLMLAINGGKNFYFGRGKWLASVYAGGGYLNIGEPRLVKLEENVFKQEVLRMPGVFGKAGTRLGYKTKVKMLQTIYFDASWFTSPVQVQGYKLNGLSLFLGTRMSMN
jgi:hypothetical protein